MVQKILYLALFLISACAALFIFHTVGSAVYFVLIGLFILVNAAALMIGDGWKQKLPLLCIILVVALSVAGQFDADFIKIVNTIIIAGFIVYELLVSFRKLYKNNKP